MILESKIVKNTLFLYFRMLLNMGVTFYTSRIVLQMLGVEDYGIYNVVGGLIIAFSFFSTAMSNSTQRFLTFELGQKSSTYRLNKVFSTSINIHILIALIILIGGETIGLYFLNQYMKIPADRIIAANVVYQSSLLSCCLGIITLPYNAIIIAYERMNIFAYISIMDVMLKLVVAYILYIVAFDKLITYSLLMLLVAIIPSAIYFLYDYHNFRESRYRYLKDIPLFKSMCGFAGWNTIGNLAYIGLTQGLNILLNLFFGASINAARGIAVQLQGAIGQFSRNFQMAVNPQITKKYAAHEYREMFTLVFISSKFSFFLLFLIALPLILQTNRVLIWWLGNVPSYTVIFFKIIICISMIDVLTNPLNIAAQATGKIKIYQIFEGGTLLMIVPVSYCVLCIFHKPELVFIVHLIFAIIAQIIRLLLLKKMINLPILLYLKEVIYKILLVILPTLICLYGLNILFYNIINNFFICSLTSVLITMTFIYIWGLTSIEKNFLITKIKSILSNH